MHWGRITIAAAGGALVAIAALACRQIVGIGDDPPASGASGGCGIPFTGSCEECVAASCCKEAAACAGDPSCAPFASCQAACNGDPACRSQCVADNQPIGNSTTFGPLYRCTVAHCENACNLPCGGAGPFFTAPDAAATCQACLSHNACGAIRDCTTDDTCVADEYCALSCQGRTDCYTTCGFQSDAGSPLLASAVGAIKTCGSACALGEDWTCIGHVNWPFPRAATSAVHLSLYDAISMKPAASVQASVCAVDGTCDSVVGASDDAGLVTVEVPLPSLMIHDSAGPTGAIFLSAAADAGASGVAPALLYWGMALSEPALGPIGVPLTTPGESVGIRDSVDAGPLQSGRGLLFVNMTDCMGAFAPGVKFGLLPHDGATQLYYFENNNLSKTATMTDPIGAAVASNVIAGTVQVTATLTGSGEIVGRESVTVQPGVTTLLFMHPTPTP